MKMSRAGHVQVEGDVTMTHGATGRQEVRHVYFRMPRNATWVEVVDRAHELALGDWPGLWLVEDEDLHTYTAEEA